MQGLLELLRGNLARGVRVVLELGDLFSAQVIPDGSKLPAEGYGKGKAHVAQAYDGNGCAKN